MPLNSSVALNQPTPRNGPRLFPRAHPADSNGVPPRPELPEGSVMPKTTTAVNDFTPTTPEQAATTSRSPPAERTTSPQSADEARPGSSQSNRNSKSSKKNSLVAFLTLKEPSTKALEDFADAEREKAKQKGAAAATASAAVPPSVSTQKLPDYVPKVNSKWDGMPESASRKSADLGPDDGRRKQSTSSKHSRRSPNSSNPSTSPDLESRPTSPAVMRNFAAAGLYEAHGSGSESAGSRKPSPSAPLAAAAAAPESRSVEPKADELILAPLLRPYEPPIPPRSPERKSFQLNMGPSKAGEDTKTTETTLPKMNDAPILKATSPQPDYAGLQVVSALISEAEPDRKQDFVAATAPHSNPTAVRPMSARTAVNFSRPLRPREAGPG